MAQKFKCYVDVKTGCVYHKPVKIAGVEYVPKSNLYEITEEQAVELLENGVPLREVIRRSAEAKIEAEVDHILNPETVPEIPEDLEPTKPEPVARPKVEPSTNETSDELEILASLRSKADVVKFAGDNEITIPEEHESFTAIKSYLTSALLNSKRAEEE